MSEFLELDFDFTFLYEIEYDGKIWKLFSRKESKMPFLICKETFIPYKPSSNILIENQIIVCEDEMKKRPQLIVKNQKDVVCFPVIDCKKSHMMLSAFIEQQEKETND